MRSKLHLTRGLQISCILFRFFRMKIVDLDTGEGNGCHKLHRPVVIRQLKMFVMKWLISWILSWRSAWTFLGKSVAYCVCLSDIVCPRAMQKCVCSSRNETYEYPRSLDTLVSKRTALDNPVKFPAFEDHSSPLQHWWLLSQAVSLWQVFESFPFRMLTGIQATLTEGMVFL
jgi:hypothetical protein